MIKRVFFSGKRKDWVTKKDIRGCIFCKIAKGDKKVPSRVIHKGKEFMVIMNTFPYNTGHIQVVPIKHLKTLEEMEDSQVAALFLMVKRSMRMLDKALEPLGFNMGLNQGGEAGASIEHLHIHIVPRFKRDFGFMEVIGGTKVVPQDLDDTYEQLKKNAKALEG